MVRLRGRIRLAYFKTRSSVERHNKAAQTPAYALVVAGMYAAASMGGDMTLIVPVLVAGWLFACIGISLNKSISFRSGCVICGLALLPFIAEATALHAHFSKDRAADTVVYLPVSPSKFKTFRQVFDMDFAALGSLGNEQEIYDKENGRTTVAVPTRLHYDYGSGSKFISIFLPPGDMDLDIYVCMFYTRHIQEILRMDDSGSLKFRVESRQAGDSDSLSTDKFAFSNLIYIYALPEMKLEDKAKVIAAFREKGVTAIFRGIEYYSHNQL